MPGKFRVSEWIREEQGRRSPDPFTSRLHSDSVIDAPSTVSGWEYLLGALRSRAPGQWSANLLELSRHMTSGIFLAINTTMKQAYSAEMKVIEKTYNPEEGDVELPHTEPVCELYNKPNNDDDWADIASQLTQQISLTGIALQWIPPTDDNRWQPEEMYVIPTASALPWPPSPVYPNGSYLVQPFYPFGPFSTIPSYQSAAGARIPAEQIIRIKNDHPILRYDGYAALTAIQRIVDTVEAVDVARWTVQQKGVDPTAMITFDPKIVNPTTADLMSLRARLEALNAGPTNAGKLMFNPFGGEVTKLSHSPSEMAWEKGWEQLMAFEQACFGVPKGVSGLDDDQSFATLYARLKQFNILSLNPLLSKIARKNTKHCIVPFFGKGLYLQLKAQKIDDEDMMLKKMGIGVNAKVVRKNELRKFLELPPLDGPEGDEFVGQEQMEMAQMQLEAQAAMQDKMNAQKQRAGSDKQAENEARREADNGRPRNAMGSGSLGPRPMKSLMTNNRLADVLEKAKTNGSAVPIEAYDDGAAEYLRQRNGQK